MTIEISLIAKTQFDEEAICKFAERNGTYWQQTQGSSQSEGLVEAAGRVCYMSFGERQSPKSNSEYIRHLIDSGHESVLEHVNWTFLFEGVSRAFTHQLVRHRVGFAFSQLSQQYHDESDAKFLPPLHLEKIPEAYEAWHEAVEAARSAYEKIRRATTFEEEKLGLSGQQREALRAIRSIARSVLPNATETKIVVTANARALRHFLTVRGSIPGDSEMRIVSAQLLELVNEEAPSIFFDFRIETMLDGSPIVLKVSN